MVLEPREWTRDEMRHEWRNSFKLGFWLTLIMTPMALFVSVVFSRESICGLLAFCGAMAYATILTIMVAGYAMLLMAVIVFPILWRMTDFKDDYGHE